MHFYFSFAEEGHHIKTNPLKGDKTYSGNT